MTSTTKCENGVDNIDYNYIFVQKFVINSLKSNEFLSSADVYRFIFLSFLLSCFITVTS